MLLLLLNMTFGTDLQEDQQQQNAREMRYFRAMQIFWLVGWNCQQCEALELGYSNQNQLREGHLLMKPTFGETDERTCSFKDFLFKVIRLVWVIRDGLYLDVFAICGRFKCTHHWRWCSVHFYLICPSVVRIYINRKSMKYRMNVRHFLVKYVEFVKSEKKKSTSNLSTQLLWRYSSSVFLFLVCSSCKSRIFTI